MHDIIIVGGGPAGLTAAIYGLRAGKSVLGIEKNGFGGQIAYSLKVENIPGTIQISGAEFADKLTEQVMALGADVELENVISVEPGETFTVRTEEYSAFEGKPVILALGVKHRMLGLAGEEELTRLYAKQLKIPTFSQYEEVEQQLETTAGYDVLLLELLKRELVEWQSSSQKCRIKQAKIPALKTTDEFDCNLCPNIEEAFLQQLATSDFIKAKSNPVLVGNPGVGKTHLSIVLGIEACRMGYHVQFYSAARLAYELTEAADEWWLNKLPNAMSKVNLLIVDELSYLTFNRTKSELLFQVFSARSGGPTSLFLPTWNFPSGQSCLRTT